MTSKDSFKSKFTFYDVVIVKTSDPVLMEINNMKGVVDSLAQDIDDPSFFSYGLTLYNDDGSYAEEGWVVPESDLIPTGERDDLSSLYTGIKIRVRVDPETGEGTIVENPEDE